MEYFEFLLREDIGKIAALLTFLNNKEKEGWKLVKDVGLSDVKLGVDFNVANLEFVDVLRPGEKSINSKMVLQERVSELGANFGQRHAEFVLKNQEEIPNNLRNYKIMFPGTLWRDHRGYLWAPVLFYSAITGNWKLDFYDIDYIPANYLMRLCRLKKK